MNLTVYIGVFSVLVCMYVYILYVFMLYNGSPIMEDNKESITY